MVGLERRVGELADRALRRDRPPDRHRRLVHDAASRAEIRRWRTPSVAGGGSPVGGSGGRRRPASGSRRVRPRSPRTCASPVGNPLAGHGRGPIGGLGRAVGAAERLGQETGDRPPVLLELVQPAVVAAGDDERLDAAARLRRRADQALEVGNGHDVVGVAVDEEDRAIVGGERGRGADRCDAMAARPEVDPRRQPGERVGDRIRDREMGEPEGLAGQPIAGRPATRSRRRPRRARRPRPRGSPRSRPSSGPRSPRRSPPVAPSAPRRRRARRLRTHRR